MISAKTFVKKLLQWHHDHPHIYPWSGEKDPYKIWLSEIILQQTRTGQGRKYYEHFIHKYPTVQKLAMAGEDAILNSWKGLGYYTRARNLHKAANLIVDKYHAVFPEKYDAIKSLPGVGEYTAAAIASFAFQQAKPVMDGNVIRVLSRLLGIEESFYSSNGRKRFYEIAEKYIDKAQPASYNQAIMNFGAMQCKPRQPDCASCTFLKHCYAFNNNCIETFPVKNKMNALKKRYLHFFHIQNSQNEIAISQRTKKDIWYKLYELPCIETKSKRILKTIDEISTISGEALIPGNPRILHLQTLRQKLSHQEIIGQFYRLTTSKIQGKIKQDICFVKPENLENFAFPKIVSVYLENLNPEKVC